jgi:hypothetical protein
VRKNGIENIIAPTLSMLELMFVFVKVAATEIRRMDELEEGGHTGPPLQTIPICMKGKDYWVRRMITPPGQPISA